MKSLTKSAILKEKHFLCDRQVLKRQPPNMRGSPFRGPRAARSPVEFASGVHGWAGSHFQRLDPNNVEGLNSLFLFFPFRRPAKDRSRNSKQSCSRSRPKSDECGKVRKYAFMTASLCDSALP